MLLWTLAAALAGPPAPPPPPRSMRDLRTALDEVRNNVEGIKIKEQGYKQLNGIWWSCGTPEEAKARGARFEPTRWEGGECWRILAWNDPGQLRGGYWVVARPDGFEVHGVIDGDGDGVFAEYVATHDKPAAPITPADEY